MRRKRSTTDARAASTLGACAFVASLSGGFDFFVHAMPVRAEAAPLRAPANPRAATATERFVRFAIISGNRQSARAFAASTGPGYETPYPQPLVVRVEPATREFAKRPIVLRFTCVSRDCRFAPSEQGDDVTRVSPRAYDVRVVRGRATLPPTLSTDRVPGVFLVRVALAPRVAVRASNDVVFHLAVR